jgi:hypothetical protein
MRKLNRQEYEDFYVNMRVFILESDIQKETTKEAWQNKFIELSKAFLKDKYKNVKFTQLRHGIKKPNNRDAKEWDYAAYAFKTGDLPELYLICVMGRFFELYDESLVNFYKEGIYIRPNWSTINEY